MAIDGYKDMIHITWQYEIQIMKNLKNSKTARLKTIEFDNFEFYYGRALKENDSAEQYKTFFNCLITKNQIPQPKCVEI
ncbi:hypothetical protein ACTXT7_001308 [Hymenolepis weldensis]